MQRRRRKKAAPKDIFGSVPQIPGTSRDRLRRDYYSKKERDKREAREKRKKERREKEEKAGISKPRVQEIKIRGERHWCIDRIKPWIGIEDGEPFVKKRLRIERKPLISKSNEYQKTHERDVSFLGERRWDENILLIRNPPSQLTDEFRLKISGNTTFSEFQEVKKLIIKNEDIREIDSFPDDSDSFALVTINLESGLADD